MNVVADLYMEGDVVGDADVDVGDDADADVGFVGVAAVEPREELEAEACVRL